MATKKKATRAERRRSFEAIDREAQQTERRYDLRRAIANSGMNHTNLARMLEVDVRTVRRWLEGTRKIDGPASLLIGMLAYNTKYTMEYFDASLIKNGAYT